MSRGDYDRRYERDDSDRYRDEPRGGYRDRDYEREGNIATRPVRREGSRHGYRRKDYGNWDGRVESVPGRLNSDNTPDMRDALNREKFLGESPDERRDQRVMNLQGRGQESREILSHRRDNRENSARRREPEPAPMRESERLRRIDLSILDEIEDCFEEMSEEELIQAGKKINNLEYRFLQEMEHREIGSGHHQNGKNQVRTRRDDQDREERRKEVEDDPNVPRNQDGSPDLRTKEAGGGNQGQGRVTDPEQDDRLNRNRDQGDRGREISDRRTRDYDDRPRDREVRERR